MSKFSLTINSDSLTDIAAFIAHLSGSTVAPGVVTTTIAPTVTAAPVADASDDDSGPINATAPQVDSAGMPWDERIHAKTKGVKADGTWKRGRGVTDDQVAAVEAEHRAKNASPIPNAGNAPVQPNLPPQQAPNALAPQADPASMPAQPMTQPPVAQNIPANFTAPSPEQPVQTPAQPNAPAGLDFNGLMTGLQGAMQAGKLDVAGLSAAVAEINAAWNSNLQQITDLVQHPHMLEWVKTYFEQRGKWGA